ncbi:PSPA7_2676 family Cys-rich small protein [Pseudomonas sp. TE3610]
MHGGMRAKSLFLLGRQVGLIAAISLLRSLEECVMSIICFVRGCEWVAYPLQMPSMTCERCERCGSLRYHHVMTQ